jgi:hypothetical protein
MTSYDTQTLAEKIAALLTETEVSDLSNVRSDLQAVNERLDRLEIMLASFSPANPRANFEAVSGYPSEEKFAIAEAVAHSMFEGTGSQKACAFEPNGKPCDHCSMCSSRGF